MKMEKGTRFQAVIKKSKRSMSLDGKEERKGQLAFGGQIFVAKSVSEFGVSTEDHFFNKQVFQLRRPAFNHGE